MATATPLGTSTGGPVPGQKIDIDRELTCGFAGGYIRRQAKLLSRRIERSCRERVSVDDLAQQLTLHLLQRLPHFDPSQGCFDAFVTLVINRSARDIRNHTRAQKRGALRTRSLDAIGSEGGSAGFSEAIDEDAHAARIGAAGRSILDSTDLALDVASLIDSLPRRLQRVARCLATESRPSARRKLRMSKNIFDRALDELQQRFREAGLDQYLPFSSAP